MIFLSRYRRAPKKLNFLKNALYHLSGNTDTKIRLRETIQNQLTNIHFAELVKIPANN